MDGLEHCQIPYRTESEGSTTSDDRDSLRSYLEKESLGYLTSLFPDDISLGYFQALTEDDLEHEYNVKDDKDRQLLMHSILKLREESSDDEVGENHSFFKHYLGDFSFSLQHINSNKQLFFLNLEVNHRNW